MKERNYGIDLLKILACILVICLHTTFKSFNLASSFGVTTFIYYFGTLAIPLFFMVNGYFLLNKSQLTFNYVRAKIIRIIVVVVFWNILFWLLKRDFYENPIKKAVGSLVQKGYFFQFWFLGSLIIIYLSLPRLKKLLVSKRNYLVVLIILVFIGSAIQIANFLIPHPPVQSNILQIFRLWTWYTYYIIGGFLGFQDNQKFINKCSYKLAVLVAVVSSIVMPFLIFVVSKFIFHNQFAEYHYDSIFVKVWATALFIVFSRIKISKKLTYFITLLSPTIMGVFIVHTYILKGVSHFLNLSIPLTNIIGLLLVAIISFTLAYIISRIPYLKKMIAV